jgi:hypothetical protein
VRPCNALQSSLKASQLHVWADSNQLVKSEFKTTSPILKLSLLEEVDLYILEILMTSCREHITGGACKFHPVPLLTCIQIINTTS